MSKTLGEMIRSIREASGRTQAGVAPMAGISAQYWNDIERGRRIPPPDTLVRIERVLDVPTPTLLWAWVRLHVGEDAANLMLTVCAPSLPATQQPGSADGVDE